MLWGAKFFDITVFGVGVLTAIRAEERTKLIPVDYAEILGAAKLIGIYWLMTNQPLPEQTTK